DGGQRQTGEGPAGDHERRLRRKLGHQAQARPGRESRPSAHLRPVREADCFGRTLIQEADLPYVPTTPEERQAMLRQIGVASVTELFRAIPASLQLDRPLDVPPALSEIELTQHLLALAKRNISADDAVCFLGGGAYDHF